MRVIVVAISLYCSKEFEEQVARLGLGTTTTLKFHHGNSIKSKLLTRYESFAP